MDPIKRKLKVTIEKEIEVELTPSVFGRMTVDEYLDEFSLSLWPVDGIDDVIKYAAQVGAGGSLGYEEDGLGLVNYHYSEFPRVPDTKIRVVSDEIECEFINET